MGAANLAILTSCPFAPYERKSLWRMIRAASTFLHMMRRQLRLSGKGYGKKRSFTRRMRTRLSPRSTCSRCSRIPRATFTWATRATTRLATRWRVRRACAVMTSCTPWASTRLAFPLKMRQSSTTRRRRSGPTKIWTTPCAPCGAWAFPMITTGWLRPVIPTTTSGANGSSSKCGRRALSIVTPLR